MSLGPGAFPPDRAAGSWPCREIPPIRSIIVSSGRSSTGRFPPCCSQHQTHRVPRGRIGDADAGLLPPNPTPPGAPGIATTEIGFSSRPPSVAYELRAALKASRSPTPTARPADRGQKKRTQPQGVISCTFCSPVKRSSLLPYRLIATRLGPGDNRAEGTAVGLPTQLPQITAADRAIVGRAGLLKKAAFRHSERSEESSRG